MVGGCGRFPFDYSKDSRNTEPLTPGLRTEKELTDSRSLQGVCVGPTSQRQFIFLVTVWTTMKPPCAVNRAKNQLSTSQFFKRRRTPRSADCILRLSWRGVTREGRSCPAIDPVSRPSGSQLGPQFCRRLTCNVSCFVCRPLGMRVRAIFLVPKSGPFRDDQNSLTGHVCSMLSEKTYRVAMVFGQGDGENTA